MKKRKAPLWKKLRLRWGERRGRLAAEGEGFSFKRPAQAAVAALSIGFFVALREAKKANYSM